MRVFVAGANGVIGRALVVKLLQDGHLVAGMTRSLSGIEWLTDSGAQPVMCDVYDRASLIANVCDFRPEVLIHQLTDLPDAIADLPSKRSDNARIRVEGTRHLLEAAARSGTQNFLAQSVAWRLPPGPGADAVATLERLVLEANGVVLRYGRFYGPNTYYQETLPNHPRVSVETAAQATIASMRNASGVVVVRELS